MCGIVGYVGHRNSKQIIISGLKKLEYRGYDSAGIGLFNTMINRYECYKEIGKVVDLEASVKHIDFSCCGIGHTRWATHGKVSRENAHPHVSSSGRFMIVHNGVIENHRHLRDGYLSDYSFLSNTDTEIIVLLIEKFASKCDTHSAIMQVLKLLKGSYALLIADQETPHRLYAAKNKSPLLIGVGQDDYVIASDIIALSDYCTHYHAIEDNRMIVLENNAISMYDYDNKTIKPEYELIEHNNESTELGAYPHYMIKEILEQPSCIRRMLKHYFIDETLQISQTIINGLKSADSIHILAAGTSMHAGYIGKRFFETFANKPTHVHIASEFAYHPPIFSDNPYVILISQSGETADLRASLKLVQRHQFPTLTITNVKTSTLAREVDHYLEIFAGKEIAVASTKAYTAQIAVLAILASTIGNVSFDIYHELSLVCQVMDSFLAQYQDMQKYAKNILTKRNAFYIGRGLDYSLALEAALKLKEVSYIQTEGFAAGELKHGTIALIEENTPVIALISEKNVALNTRSNLDEVISRGAKTITIVLNSLSHPDDDIILEDVHPLLAPLVMVLPTQLLAYYAALERGLDIDKPRNLAKSVTVE